MTIKKKLGLYICFFILSLSVVNIGFSQKKKRYEQKVHYKIDTVIIRDTIIKYIEKPIPLWNDSLTFKHIPNLKTLDSLVTKLFTDKHFENQDYLFGNFVFDDTLINRGKLNNIPDSVIKSRLDKMYSDIRLPYNPLMREYISTYIDHPQSMEIYMQRAIYYFPLIEKELIKQGMPLELKYLPLIESSLIPNALSKRGNTGGLWQFTTGTAKIYGLNIGTYIDERFDPYKSTLAACKYMKDLYKIYKNWTLVIAAYNCGPVAVNKALASVKDANNYWDIYKLLPRITRAYVPKFIAANYAFNFHRNHGIEMNYPIYSMLTDTVTVSDEVLDFKKISSVLGLSYETIKYLNPQFLRDKLPAQGQTFTLVLPASVMSEFVSKKDQLFEKKAVLLQRDSYSEKTEVMGSDDLIHTVRSGDLLGKIANKYGTSVKKIMKDNALLSADKLKIGQKLKIIR